MNDGTNSSNAAGAARTTDEWLPLVYAELRQLAALRMAREASDHTLQPTALVHEVWLRLVGAGEGAWVNRSHFFCAAAEAMRRILVERARRKARIRHGGGLVRSDAEDGEIASSLPDERLLDLNGALDQLAALDARAAEVVKLRFFLGLTEEETAKELGVSVNTIERVWKVSRVWLFRELSRK
ncbi:MAG: sigma-70 family RNA polymerase sigma factor [Verrucomicrobiales bacterium]|nr:sigma-70 family RNA polymerase sigma factor [Verrucomicrobiales bacterium]